MAATQSIVMRNDDVDIEKNWAELSTSIEEIHTQNASALSFESLYRNAYRLVLKKMGDDLHARVVGWEETFLQDRVRREITQHVTSSILLAALGEADIATAERKDSGERFLRAARGAFATHVICMGMITDVLMYMDRVCCRDRGRPSIYTTAMDLFRRKVLNTAINNTTMLTTMEVLLSVILSMIQLERNGEIIDRTLISGCVEMFERLYESLTEDENTKIYLTVFEPRFLSASANFYSNEGLTLVRTADASTFCKQAKKRLKEEEERCQQTLSMITQPKIQKVVDQELIGRHLQDVIQMEDTGVRNMLETERIEDLTNVFELISRVDSKKELLRIEIQRHVITLGKAINENAGNILATPPKSTTDTTAISGAKKPSDKPLNQQTAAAIRWVEDVLQLKSKYYSIWDRAFKKDSHIEKGLETSFQEFIDGNQRSPEHLSLFLDEYLKKGVKGKTDDEIDILLENGITLLQYIGDKDVFETYYKKHLSRRLLMKRSASMDLERSMIAKMKLKVGNQFTQKLEAMFRDMATSDDLTAGYKEYVSSLGDPDPSRIELEVSVLTSTMWPMEHMIRAEQEGRPQTKCTFPPAVDRVREGFEHFYLHKHNGRALSWQGHMGTADIRATFKKPGSSKTSKHELNVSTYAMLVLLLFNDLAADEALSFEEIQARTEIPENELIRNLQSLAINPKTRVLRKEPKGKEIEASDRFYFNEDFQSLYYKVKIGVVSNSASKLETIQERAQTEKRTNDERTGHIDAAVVRIMKQRKQLTHQRLMTEVIAQLSSRFQPDVSMIKARLESLIEREYIERVEDTELPSYKYLA
ncbi:MAG: hypothetical protein Q9227_002349 [Pyrenula ochraceoflavens]